VVLADDLSIAIGSPISVAIPPFQPARVECHQRGAGDDAFSARPLALDGKDNARDPRRAESRARRSIHATGNMAISSRSQHWYRNWLSMDSLRLRAMHVERHKMHPKKAGPRPPRPTRRARPTSEIVIHFLTRQLLESCFYQKALERTCNLREQMNIDSRHGPEVAEARDFELQRQQTGDTSAQTGSPAHPSEDQVDFEQQLDRFRPVDRTSDCASSSANPGIGPSSTATNGPRPGERCSASSFVGARAQLAATLTGATLAALRNEIELAEQQSAPWSSASGPADRGVDRERIFNDVVGSSYVELRRFQNADGDCKPRRAAETSAISYVRDAAREHSSVGDHPERYPMTLARQAGWHMRGKVDSPFVSLIEDPSKLSASRDPWARAIANNATMLHTYTIPKSAVWTPDQILSSIALGMNVDDHENIDADVDLMCSLGRTPTRETERLFLGGDLEAYRTARQENPFKTESTD